MKVYSVDETKKVVWVPQGEKTRKKEKSQVKITGISSTFKENGDCYQLKIFRSKNHSNNTNRKGP